MIKRLNISIKKFAFSEKLSKILNLSAGIAQLVERNLAKVEVASSRLVSRSRFTKVSRPCVGLFFTSLAGRVTELVDVADLKSAAN